MQGGDYKSPTIETMTGENTNNDDKYSNRTITDDDTFGSRDSQNIHADNGTNTNDEYSSGTQGDDVVSGRGVDHDANMDDDDKYAIGNRTSANASNTENDGMGGDKGNHTDGDSPLDDDDKYVPGGGNDDGGSMGGGDELSPGGSNETGGPSETNDDCSNLGVNGTSGSAAPSDTPSSSPSMVRTIFRAMSLPFMPRLTSANSPAVLSDCLSLRFQWDLHFASAPTRTLTQSLHLYARSLRVEGNHHVRIGSRRPP